LAAGFRAGEETGTGHRLSRLGYRRGHPLLEPPAFFDSFVNSNSTLPAGKENGPTKQLAKKGF
jgi:hypothetical protein